MPTRAPAACNTELLAVTSASKLVAVLLVVTAHISNERGLVPVWRAFLRTVDPRFEVRVEGMKIPAPVVLAKMRESFICKIAVGFIYSHRRLAGTLAIRLGGMPRSQL